MKSNRNLPIVVIILVLLSPSISLKGQVTREILETPVNLRQSVIRIDSLLRILARQTGVEFSFNSTRVKPSGTITIPSKRLSLSQFLELMEKDRGLQHRIVGNHVILMDKNKNAVDAAPSKKATTGEYNRKATFNAGKNRVPPRAATNPGNNLATKNPVKRVVSVETATDEVENTTNKNTPPKRNSGIAGNNVKDYPIMARRLATDTSIRLDNPDEASGSTQHRALFPNVIDTQAESVKKRAVKLVKLAQDPTVASSQTKQNGSRAYAAVMPLTKVDLGLQGVGFSFERKLSHHSIIDLSIGAGGGYAITGQEFTYKLNINAPDFYVSVNPRFYYNRSKRAEKEKSMRMNAGNYFGVRLKYVTDAFTENFVVWDALLFNIHWGFQRPIGGHWLLNGHIGPGYGFAANLLQYNHWYPSCELKFSYVFGKRGLEE